MPGLELAREPQPSARTPASLNSANFSPDNKKKRRSKESPNQHLPPHSTILANRPRKSRQNVSFVDTRPRIANGRLLINTSVSHRVWSVKIILAVIPTPPLNSDNFSAATSWSALTSPPTQIANPSATMADITGSRWHLIPHKLPIGHVSILHKK